MTKTKYYMQNYGYWLLIAANIAVFAGIHIAHGRGVDLQRLLQVMTLSSAPDQWLTRPYTFLTNIFTQWGVMHIAFNMLWLWGFAALARRAGIGSGGICGAYFAGGIAGGAAFVACAALGLTDGLLLGSSSAVLAIVTMCAVAMPRAIRVSLMGFGEMSMPVLAALLTVVFIVFSIADGNSGGAIAHLAGALAGAGAGLLRKVWLRHRLRPVKATRGRLTPEEEEEMDRLLVRVRDNGFNSLSIRERQRLFQLSGKGNGKQ